MSQHDRYISPFSTRYASDEMQYIFSDDNKFRTWRRLWVALARAEMKQGLTNITPEMVAELEAHVDDINYDVAIAREKLVRHDVMSHVYAYGVQCPEAKGIIHLGATSCYVTDNADLILYRDGLRYLRGQLLAVMKNLSAFAGIPFEQALPAATSVPARMWRLDGVTGSLRVGLRADMLLLDERGGIDRVYAAGELI